MIRWTFPRLAAAVAVLAAGATIAVEADAFGGRRGMGGGGGGGGSGGPPPRQAEGEGPPPEIVGAFSPMGANLEAMAARGFLATGLRPAYPAGVACPEANSFFADGTRGDGSRRSPRFFQGRHGGLDIPVAEGTPILAVADGTLIQAHEGENIGGIGMILRHAPEDTGLGVWTYTEYKHLKELPRLAVGERVRMGQVIAEAGLSGTTGGYYGPNGHSHLHLSAWSSPGPDYKARMMFVPVGGDWVDPLALFKGGPIESRALAALPDAEKAVPLPYVGADGAAHPATARIVWPFACTGGPVGKPD